MYVDVYSSNNNRLIVYTISKYYFLLYMDLYNNINRLIVYILIKYYYFHFFYLPMKTLSFYQKKKEKEKRKLFCFFDTNLENSHTYTFHAYK
jgi:hypothetical protein